MQPRYISLPLDWRLHVRCDDPLNRCTCGAPAEKTLYAYTTNKDLHSGLARINFCPKYFKTTTLPVVIKSMKRETVPSFKYDINEYYDTQGSSPYTCLHIILTSEVQRMYGFMNYYTSIGCLRRKLMGEMIRFSTCLSVSL